MTKDEILEQMKKLTPEQKRLFREALQEDSPAEGLSGEEMSTVREMLEGYKKRKTVKDKSKGGLLEFFDSLIKD
jgi:hypothetical protein